MSKHKTINLNGVGFADASIVALQYVEESDLFCIKIKTWNAGILSIMFHDPIGFQVIGFEEIEMFREITERTPLLEQSLLRCYENIPVDQPYRHFEFVGVTDDYPFIQIIAKSFTYNLENK